MASSLAGCVGINQKAEIAQAKEPTPLVIESKTEDELPEVRRYSAFRHSQEWMASDEMYLCKLAAYYGGNAEQQKYNMLVTLNRVWTGMVDNDSLYPPSIREVTLTQLYEVEGVTSFQFEEINYMNEVTKEAYSNLVYGHEDNSEGSYDYINWREQ